MKNKKGLSGIVTTLIIILLVLVAVGVIWGVVSNLLNKSTGKIQENSQCLDIGLSATKIVPNGTNYTITLKRTATGSGQVGGKFMLYSADNNTEIKTFDNGVMFGPAEVKTWTYNSTLSNATKIDVYAYFVDQNGKETLCPTPVETDFQAQ